MSFVHRIWWEKVAFLEIRFTICILLCIVLWSICNVPALLAYDWLKGRAVIGWPGMGEGVWPVLHLGEHYYKCASNLKHSSNHSCICDQIEHNCDWWLWTVLFLHHKNICVDIMAGNKWTGSDRKNRNEQATCNAWSKNCSAFQKREG